MGKVIKKLNKGDVKAVENIKQEMGQLDRAVREERGGMARHKAQARKQELKKYLRHIGVPGV